MLEEDLGQVKELQEAVSRLWTWDGNNIMLSKTLQIQEPELPDRVKEKQEESLHKILEMETPVTKKARSLEPWQEDESSCPVWALPLQSRPSDPVPEEELEVLSSEAPKSAKPESQGNTRRKDEWWKTLENSLLQDPGRRYHEFWGKWLKSLCGHSWLSLKDLADKDRFLRIRRKTVNGNMSKNGMEKAEKKEG